MAKSRVVRHFEDTDLRLTLSPREKRRLLRAAVKAEMRAPDKATLMSKFRDFLDSAAQGRATASARPGRRGWLQPGAGRVNYVESPVEYQGTTVQVCGLWPFIAGSGSPTVGVPLGRNLLNGSTVCGDPVFWFLSNLVLNPSCFVLGRPGLGKSTLIRRMVTVLQAWGIVPMILGDTKPDYVDLILAMAGQVITLGRGRDSMNPLDLGPLMRELVKIEDEDARRVALEEMRGRRFNMFAGLLALLRNDPLKAHELSIVSEALRILDETMTNPPLVGDVLRLITEGHPRLLALAIHGGSKKGYHKRVEGLLDLLTALGESGPFGDLFCRPTTRHVELGVPMVFDLSKVDDSDGQLLAGLQAVCWNYGSAIVSADKHLADAGLREPRHYFLVMDELWRMLRASATMVHFVDALTRLNRTRGIGQAMCTHTMNDLEMATEQLTKLAWGFVERSAMVYIGGLADAEMGNLEKVFGMSSREKDMISDWSADSSINPDTSEAAVPPGRGKFLLKVGKPSGTPFELQLTEEEKRVNDTNQAWKMASERAADAAAKRAAAAAERELEASAA
jgi:hypothetical protein